jgi:hypothetical protein
MKDNNTQLDYNDNSFSNHLIDLMSEFLKNGDKRDGYDINKNNYHLLNEKEKYRQRVWGLYCKMNNSIDNITHIKVFLRRYNREFLFKNGIDDLSYIQYHLEVLFHKVHTILDLMKLMINEVYRLDISPKECSWDSLESRLNKNKEKPLLIINKYFTFFKNIIEMRHLNTHRGLFIDDKKEEIEINYGFGLYKMVEGSYSAKMTDVLNVIPINAMKHKVKVYRSERIEFVQEVHFHIMTFAQEFYTSLYEKFSLEMK